MVADEKYSPTKRLGAGPFSEVFLAREKTGLGRTVAVKRLREEFLSQANRREAFLAAAERWSRHPHDNLVLLIDLDRASGAVVYGPFPSTVADKIASGSSTEATVVALMRQAFSGLKHLHDQGLLHLNLKPSNLLIDHEGGVRLADGQCVEPTQLGELPAPRGSQKYLAPESIDAGIGEVGRGADVYCLGFVMLEVLAGPGLESLFGFSGTSAAESDRNWVRWHADKSLALPPLTEAPFNASPLLARVLERALNKDPLQRYHSAAELLQDLSAADTQSGADTPAGGEPAPVARVVDKATTQRGADAEPPKLNDIPKRPAAPIVLRFLGSDAEMVGLNTDYFTVGTQEDCDVVLPASSEDVCSIKLRFSRGADGWRVTAADEAAFYVNQEPVKGLTPLRSGDIVRPRLWQPGMQFTVLHQDVDSVAKLASRYAPRLVQKPASRPAAPSPGGAPPRPDGAAAAVAKPAPPSRPTPVAPPRPGGAAPPKTPKREGAAPIRSKQATAVRVTVAPNQSATPAPTGQPSEGSSVLQKIAALTDTSQLSSSQKNWLITVVIVVTMAIVIGFWPADEEPKDAPAERASGASQEAPTDGELEQPTSTAPASTPAGSPR